jgi:hypothetical protein
MPSGQPPVSCANFGRWEIKARRRLSLLTQRGRSDHNLRRSSGDRDELEPIIAIARRADMLMLWLWGA